MIKFKNLSYSKKVITIASIILAIVFLFTFFTVGLIIDKKRKKEVENKKEYETNNEIVNENRVNLLLIGVDDIGDATEKTDYINASFSDFLFILSFDMNKKICYSLQIDRDTMTKIPMYTRSGKYAGLSKEEMQICYSYCYGDGMNLSCLNTQRTVENLLFGLKIDYYASVTMDAIPIINDFAGGVTVTIEDDFSSIKPEWKIGDTVILHGKEAETFVRSRKGIAGGNNANRMKRQKAFMDGLLKNLKTVNKSVTDLMTDLNSTVVTNYNASVIDKIYSERANYEFKEAVSLPGIEYSRDETEGGKVVKRRCFDMDEEKTKELLTELFELDW